MSFTIKKATRQGVKPLIGLYAESGCGKTYSALLLARGLVGPNGKIVLLDTESGRGSLYADVLPGGYEVLEMEPPFTPANYIAALGVVAQSGAQVAIVDSASHEWEGIGGVLDMAGELESKSGRAGLHNWKTPKMEHAKFMLHMLQSPLPTIVCLRAKYKTRQTKENGKTVIVKDEYTTPIQADDFIFEMTAHAEILQDHSIKLTKCSHPSLRECFPSNGPIKIEHGEKIAQWCANAGAPAKEDTTALKAELWKLLEPVRGKEKNWKIAQQWMIDEMVLDPEKTVNDLTAGEFRAAILSVAKKLKERTANATA